MTVCIGALSKGSGGMMSPVAVVASDRMITMGNIQEFEHEIPKVTELNKHAVVLTAGDAIRGFKLVSLIRDKVAGQNIAEIQQIADVAAKTYAECRDQSIEADIFRPRGLTRQQLYIQVLQGIQSPLILQMDMAVATYNYGVELLIAGVDSKGAQLYSINNPGANCLNYHSIGYHAIGSGAIHALQSFIVLRHCLERNPQETLFNVYVSKKRAEVAPGVGNQTDLFVITAGGITKLNGSNLDKLEELLQEYQRPIQKELAEKIQKLPEYDNGNDKK